MKKIKNGNVELVEKIMLTGSPLNQIFVMDALIKWSNHIINNKEEVLKSLENTMIRGPAWIEAAEHCKKMLDERHA
jgi:hypothetical protein